MVLDHMVRIRDLGTCLTEVTILPTGFAPGAAALGLRGGFDEAVRRWGLGGVGRVLVQTGFQLGDALVRVFQLGPQLHDQRSKLLVGGRALVEGSHQLIAADACATVEPIN